MLDIRPRSARIKGEGCSKPMRNRETLFLSGLAFPRLRGIATGQIRQKRRFCFEVTMREFHPLLVIGGIMSIKEMSRVWDDSKQNGNRLLLLLAMADYADDNGYCWPSIDTLAQKTRMSSRTVMRAIDDLISDAEIAAVRVRNTGNKYVILTGCSLKEKYRRTKSISDRLSENATDCHIISDIAVSLDPPVIIKETSKDTPSLAGKQKKPRKRDPMFDALVGVCKLDPKTAGSFIGKTKRILFQADYKPEDVIRFGEIWYTREFPGGKSDGKPPSPACVAKYIGWVNDDSEASVSSWIPTAEEAAK